MESGLIIWPWSIAIVSCVAAIGLFWAYRRARRYQGLLEERHRSVERMVDQANDAVLVLDFVDGKILYANARAGAMLDFPADGLPQRSVSDLFFPEDLGRSAERIADVWTQGGLVFDDLPMRKADGGRLPVECSGKVMEYGGRPAVVLNARDITDRLRLEREVAGKNALVEQYNQEMRSSLRYAQGIQLGMMPGADELRAAFGEGFVINLPRDIVSGDFFWCGRYDGKALLAVADCTGHGVPGALLSTTGMALIRQVLERGVLVPGEILLELRKGLQRALDHQAREGGIRDGMAIGVLVRDLGTGALSYAGSFCPLYILRGDGSGVEVVKGDRVPLLHEQGGAGRFTELEVIARPGDRMFMASDGFADQFGGPEGRKLMTRGLKDLMLSTADVPLQAQGARMGTAFSEWRGQFDQVDDVLLVGIQL